MVKYQIELMPIDALIPHANAMQDEIERLNAQVAMLRTTFENIRDGLYIKSFPNSDEIEMTKSVIKNAIGFTESDWLTAHDAKVRDDALEEVAIATWQSSGLQQFERHKFRADIRAMKSKQ